MFELNEDIFVEEEEPALRLRVHIYSALRWASINISNMDLVANQ